MSRLGKLPIKFSENTKVEIKDNFIFVSNSNGELKQELNEIVDVKIEKNEVIVSVKDKDDKKEKAMWGLYRSLIQNMVIGVESGYEKKLEINGVGYGAVLSGSKLTLKVGFSHPVEFIIPSGIKIAVEKNIITISGIDKQQVGQVAANIRKVKKPEPYKGKGIKYSDEVIIRKEGKSAKGE